MTTDSDATTGRYRRCWQPQQHIRTLHGANIDCPIPEHWTADLDAAATTTAAELNSHEIRQQILDRIDTSPKAMWIRAAYDLGHMDGAAEAAAGERQRIRDGAVAMTLDGCLVTGTAWPSSYLVPADLLDGDRDA